MFGSEELVSRSWSGAGRRWRRCGGLALGLILRGAAGRAGRRWRRYGGGEEVGEGEAEGRHRRCGAEGAKRSVVEVERCAVEGEGSALGAEVSSPEV